MAEQTLSDTLKAVEALLDKAIAEAGAKVESGPDNPAVNRTATSGLKAFTISSAAVFASDNWTPFFHDWKAQYEFVKELLAARRFSDLKKMLDGKSVDQNKLAPEVIAHVRSITGDSLN